MEKKKLSYSILLPPLDKSYDQLNERETQEFFDWYISEIPKRIEYMSTVCSNQLGISHTALDLSPKSLILLWDWFLKIADVEKTPKAGIEEIKDKLGKHYKSFIDYVVNESREQFSLETEYILRDIGMYLGETFVRNHKKIVWGYHTDIERDSFANIPLLIGFEDADFHPPFKMEFEPIHMAGVQAGNIQDNTQSKEDLFNLYQKWMRLIPEEN